jgi:hypothetical protein
MIDGDSINNPQVGLGNINNFKNKYIDPCILLYDLYN